MRFLRSCFALFAVAFLLLVPVLAFAQAAPGADPIVMPDWQTLVAAGVLALAASLTPLLTYGVRLAFARIPRIALPFVAMLFSGPTVTWVLAALTPLAAKGYGWGVVAGLLGWAIREVYNTYQQHGLGPGAPTPTAAA